MDTLIARKCSDGSVEVWRSAATDHQPIMRFASYLTNKPDYRHKYVTYNCARYNVRWDKRQ